ILPSLPVERDEEPVIVIDAVAFAAAGVVERNDGEVGAILHAPGARFATPPGGDGPQHVDIALLALCSAGDGDKEEYGDLGMVGGVADADKGPGEPRFSDVLPVGDFTMLGGKIGCIARIAISNGQGWEKEKEEDKG